MSRHQVFLGRPLFLFPWGFHVSVCLVMLDVGFLSVWPIQRHLLRFISIYIGSWLVLVHKVLLLTLSDHFKFMILRRHLFKNVCILFIVCLVILHVSELYNWTDAKIKYSHIGLQLDQFWFPDFTQREKGHLCFLDSSFSVFFCASCLVDFTAQICETVCFLQWLPFYGDYVLALCVSLHNLSLVQIDVN